MLPAPLFASPPLTFQVTAAAPPPESVAENCSTAEPEELVALQPVQFVSIERRSGSQRKSLRSRTRRRRAAAATRQKQHRRDRRQRQRPARQTPPAAKTLLCVHLHRSAHAPFHRLVPIPNQKVQSLPAIFRLIGLKRPLHSNVRPVHPAKRCLPRTTNELPYAVARPIALNPLIRGGSWTTSIPAIPASPLRLKAQASRNVIQSPFALSSIPPPRHPSRRNVIQSRFALSSRGAKRRR